MTMEYVASVELVSDEGETVVRRGVECCGTDERVAREMCEDLLKRTAIYFPGRGYVEGRVNSVALLRVDESGSGAKWDYVDSVSGVGDGVLWVSNTLMDWTG